MSDSLSMSTSARPPAHSTKPALWIAGAGGVLLAAGLVAGLVEARPYLALAPEMEPRIALLATAPVQPGLSIDSARLVLDSCTWAMTSLAGRTQPTQIRNRIAQNCRLTAKGIVAVSPSSAEGWYVLALAAAQQGRRAEFSANLIRSQAVAPNEEWLAALRVALAEARHDWTNAGLTRIERADIAVLLASRRGVAAMAARFVEDPGFRARATEIADQLPPETQARFVAALRRLVPDGPAR